MDRPEHHSLTSPGEGGGGGEGGRGEEQTKEAGNVPSPEVRNELYSAKPALVLF